MAAKKKYYNIAPIMKLNARYMLLLGKRSNGKSYQVKLTCLTNAYKKIKNGECFGKFVYLRRLRDDIVPAANVESYFGDMPIETITKGEYNRIVAYQGYIYFALSTENGIVKGPIIGRYCALRLAERYKSQTFIDYDYIIYEEFITDKMYLVNEPRELQQFISTVARLKSLQVFLIGNTLSRVCPYFDEWSLAGVLKQKIGTIEMYHYHVGEDTIDMAVERCAETEQKNTMFFGQASKQILSGEWDTYEMPKLPKPLEYYEKIYELIIKFQGFKFCLELLIDEADGGRFCFIYPFKGKRKIDRIIQEEFSTSPFISNRLDLNRKAEAIMVNCFKINKVCYSDNLTGTDFQHVIDAFKFV